MGTRRRGLAIARTLAGYTQERFAEAVGVDRSTVSRWESGESTPLAWVRPKVASVLHVSVDRVAELLADDPDETDIERKQRNRREAMHSRVLEGAMLDDMETTGVARPLLHSLDTERAVALRPHVELAFNRQCVSIDFAGFSGETLAGSLQEPLDKIRIGGLRSDQITLRVLLPDLTVPVGLPAFASTGADDERGRLRSQEIASRFIR
jgi:transcriptional regulator with XRE-family HTH domain